MLSSDDTIVRMFQQDTVPDENISIFVIQSPLKLSFNRQLLYRAQYFLETTGSEYSNLLFLRLYPTK